MRYLQPAREAVLMAEADGAGAFARGVERPAVYVRNASAKSNNATAASIVIVKVGHFVFDYGYDNGRQHIPGARE